MSSTGSKNFACSPIWSVLFKAGIQIICNSCRILIALKDSFVDQSEYNNEIISKLNKRVETLRGRISNIYMDKLDKKIDDEFWREKHNEWTYEVSECLEKISYYTNANADYMKLGGELLELLENLYPRYINQNKEEKKNLLKIIFSNLTLEGRNKHRLHI